MAETYKINSLPEAFQDLIFLRSYDQDKRIRLVPNKVIWDWSLRYDFNIEKEFNTPSPTRGQVSEKIPTDFTGIIVCYIEKIYKEKTATGAFYQDSYGGKKIVSLYQYPVEEARRLTSNRGREMVRSPWFSHTAVYQVAILRVTNGKIHSAEGPAYEKASLTTYNFMDLDGNPIEVPDAYLEYNKIKREDLEKIKRESGFFLNGCKVTQKAFKEAKEKGAVETSSISSSKNSSLLVVSQDSRIKFEGILSLGEELEAFGLSNKILWLRIGEELWALEKTARKKPGETRNINDKRKSMKIEETNKTRYFEVSQQEIEEKFAENLPILLMSTSATSTRAW